ncbi:hypothetical protein RHSIM_Rhsim11G0176500 [Rhododendron simsii]|uniref:KIB1-4 beta-propeller domain-containing protein n=1 Tax=Rhododendron simsii TaxID=118357 RepID=A0A834G4M1_RHOSS|nr:hypothetical protein RHSIM_Rhsim11G0176500 [Rhododendron simsii]
MEPIANLPSSTDSVSPTRYQSRCHLLAISRGEAEAGMSHFQELLPGITFQRRFRERRRERQSFVTICFGAVCKPWHAAADHQKDHRRRELVHKPELPMLLIPPPAETAEEADYHCRSLHSVTRRKVLNLELRVSYPRRCCGSLHGWLATKNEADAGITLLNPFSGKSFRFPKQTPNGSGGSSYSHKANKVYIVKSHEGDLLMVRRFLEWRANPRRWATSCFKIFKVLGLGGSVVVVAPEVLLLAAMDRLLRGLKSIVYAMRPSSWGIIILYLRLLQSSDCPGCRPNCIYYTDDTIDYNMPYYPYGSRDTGIYYSLDRSFAPHYRVKTK